MAFTYAVPDIHGRLDLLELALAAIENRDFDLGKPGGTVVFLGDYIDRGPDSRGVVDRLMRGTDGDMTWVCLIGNHEQMMLQAAKYRARDSIEWWCDNGGCETLESYGVSAPDLIRSDHIAWLGSLPLWYEDRYRFFVHAGIEHDVPLESQSQRAFTWMRLPADDGRGYRGRHIVHGHTPSRKNPITLEGRTNLDTGAFKYGRLVVGVFEDEKPGGPIEILEVKSK